MPTTFADKKSAHTDRVVPVTDAAGESAGSVSLPGALFDAPASVPLLHQVVVAQLAAARQGTHSTKTRGEVRGGGKKPYKQKGTGRARQGSLRAPQFTGGGIVHGPTPRDYSQRTPRKMKAAALRGALSDRARGGRVHVVTSLVAGDAPSTATAVRALARLSTAAHVLVVLARSEEMAWRSLRNVAEVHLLHADQLNTYDVLVSDDVVFSRAALDAYVAQATGMVADDAVTAEPADVAPTHEPAGAARPARAAQPAEAAEPEESR